MSTASSLILSSISTSAISESTRFDDNDLQFDKELHGFTTVACQLSEASLNVVSNDFAQKSSGTDKREGDLEDIFFSHEPFLPFAEPTRRVDEDEVGRQVSFKARCQFTNFDDVEREYSGFHDTMDK